MKQLLLLFVLALSAPLALAQDQGRSAAFSTVLDHLSARAGTFGLTATDFDDAAVTDEYTSRTSGATHLYLRQTVNGIEVFNARASAHIASNGRIAAAHADFVPSATARANAPTPTLSAEAAVEAAAVALGLTLTDGLTVVEPVDARHRLVLSDGGVSLEPIPVQLVYFAREDGALRLAYDLSILPAGAKDWWSLRIDAETGAVLDRSNWMISERWVPSEDRTLADLRPIAETPTLAARGGSASYNVWPYPLEAPTFGPRELVVDPADPTASSLGWHDDGNTTYTITRGNNAYAYSDRLANNTPGFSPDGGADLVFDFEVDFDTDLPVEYRDVAVTNLFYWNNLIHDVLFRYGFDEAAGNFQQTNISGEGLGNDYVLAEAQNGADAADCDPNNGTPDEGPCLNNANFGTPADGGRPRMQMFEWQGPPTFGVSAPDGIAGFYPTAPSTFGPEFSEDFPDTEIVVVEDLNGNVEGGAGRACGEIFNTDELEGNIALIQRGDCNFDDKVFAAEQAGAIAAIIHNNSRTGAGETGNPEDLVTMGGDGTPEVTIPSAFVQQSTGILLVDNAPAMGFLRPTLNRDSDLDNGIIAHEYGHGVSKRLTGGPANASCLGNQEQMGEGWSDYFALMLTMTEVDTGAGVNGIGTYVSYEDPEDGPGIRPAPYSTDTDVNDFTYSRIDEVSIPHGVGFVWASMLWDMTWNIIDTEGFTADLIGETAGNTIALQLVMEGLKLQPCRPGFVDGRDAILNADTLLYEGAYSDAIWSAFAARGLGFSADQGEINSVTDGTEAFDLPPQQTAGEDDAAAPGVYELTAAYPNPFTQRARFTLEVAEAQDVTVAVFDVMGREVARLHDGLVAAGSRRAFEVDGSTLASGVYVVRVTGETFAETRRLTLLR